MSKRRMVAWVVAAAVGTMLVPSVDAIAATKQQKRESAQNRRITKVVKQARTTALKVASVASTLGKLNTIVAENGQKLINLTTLANGIDTKVTGLDNRLKVIEGAAPTIIAGLTKLGAAYPAVEYGRAGIFAGDSDLTIAAGGTVTSADIPDDGNAVTTGENAIVVAGAGATAETLTLKAGIRSAESDGGPAEGGSSSTTAGEAGGYLYLVDLDTGVRVACTGAPNPPGIVGTQPGDSIVTPSGTVTNLPLKNLPGGFERTDTTQPTASSTTLAGPCLFTAAPGHTYQARYSVNFVDIPTTTTPGPTE